MEQSTVSKPNSLFICFIDPLPASLFLLAGAGVIEMWWDEVLWLMCWGSVSSPCGLGLFQTQPHTASGCLAGGAVMFILLHQLALLRPAHPIGLGSVHGHQQTSVFSVWQHPMKQPNEQDELNQAAWHWGQSVRQTRC